MIVDELATFPQLIRSAASAFGDDDAITLSGDSIATETLSFAELERRSALLARGLLERGVGKGSRIGFIVGNGPQFALWLAAIARIGAIAIPISTLLKSAELVRVLRQSDVSGLIVQRQLLEKDYAQRLIDALPALARHDCAQLRLDELPFLRWIVSSGDDLPAAFHGEDWVKDAAELISEALLEAAESEVHASDQMVEIYTSGSMAAPKGVRHGHGPAMFRANYMRMMLKVQQGATVRATMPMFWVGGLMMTLLPAWVAGATVACTEGTWVDSRFAMGSVLAEDDQIVYPDGMVFWALGMTETLGPYSYGDVQRVPGYPLCAPIDHIAERYEVRVADEHDQPVAVGETGEIQVRGYALSSGLHKMHRSDYFTADGFYHTGDIGFVEGERIHFIGRSGDMIKTANSNVSPAEVEEELQRLPGVHSAYVVGIPDPERGQLVVAAIVPREGEVVDFEVIQSLLKERLSAYKVPRAYFLFAREDVPMLPSNKVARREIEQELERRYAAR